MRTMRSVVAAAVALGVSVSAAGAATFETGVAGLKLIMLDKYGLGKAKAVYVAKAPGIAKGPAGDPPGLSGKAEIFPLSDPTNKAVYDLPADWLVNKDAVAKYVNKAAAPGSGGAKVVVVKTDLVAKVVAKNLGDGDSASGDQGANDLDLQALADGDTIRVVLTIDNANDGNTYVTCSDFSALAIKKDNADANFKVLSKTSTAPGTCTIAPPTTSTTTTSTTTTTTVPLCGNNVVDNYEQCDPPGSSCGGSAVCGSDCTCPCDLTTCPCDPLDPSTCLYPFPNDFFTVPDGTTDTGLRVNFTTVAMPKNTANVPIVAADYNLNDGFSPGASILLRVPGVDLAMTGAPPITDLAQSQDPDAPIVVVNATTLAHHLIWAETDSNATTEADRALIIRPAINFDEGTRYIVALRNMKDSSGTLITPNADFLAYRDIIPTGDPAKEARRPHMESLFTTLAAAGIARADLYLAWDFTVASERNLSERLLFMRDDAFARLDSASPAFVVSTVAEHPCTAGTTTSGGCATNADCGTGGVCDTMTVGVSANIFRRVSGTFQVERYVDSTTPPARFVLDSNGLPTHQATTQTARFVCIIPRAALAGPTDPAVPARPSLYGHGLLGTPEEVNAGNVQDMANEHNFVFCATQWIGMSAADVPNAVAILQDLGKFPSLTDRLQQAMVDQLFLARLLIHPNGFGSNAAFQDSSGNSVIDPSAVFFDGNSQGGIFGGTLMAIAQDITRGVLGVPGMNYSLLLTRSVDFDQYKAFLYPAYPNELRRPLLLALIQMLWDRSDPNGYAHHMTTDPLPNTPPHEVLLHEAFGDHQVANVSTEVEARTIGASIHQPAINAGRSYEVSPYPYIPAIPSYPFNGSALIIWDSGSATPPTENIPPDPMLSPDPHSDPRKSSIARQQKSDFLQTGGAVTDVCSGIPCVIPHAP
jgi:predicted esterase